MNETPDLKPTTQKTSRRISTCSKTCSIVLMISLAINLLIAGLMFSHYWRGDRFSRMQQTGFVQLVPRSFIADLPNERQHIVLNILKKYQTSLADQRSQTWAVRDELTAAITTQPYDEQKVRAIIERYTTEASNLVTTGGQAALEILDQLTPEERQALALSIKARSERGYRHHRDGHDNGYNNRP